MFKRKVPNNFASKTNLYQRRIIRAISCIDISRIYIHSIERRAFSSSIFIVCPITRYKFRLKSTEAIYSSVVLFSVRNLIDTRQITIRNIAKQHLSDYI